MLIHHHGCDTGVPWVGHSKRQVKWAVLLWKKRNVDTDLCICSSVWSVRLVGCIVKLSERTFNSRTTAPVEVAAGSAQHFRVARGARVY